MKNVNEEMKAVHLEGGNYFDDMRIDIAESHRRFAHLSRGTRSARKGSKLRNVVKLLFTKMALRFGFHEVLVANGLRRGWIDSFRGYWSDILNGRPLWSTMDFFLLLHDYRKRQQHTAQLEWNDSAQHLANWQRPQHLYSTLHNAGNLALHPLTGLDLWPKVSRGMRLLEYGCSLAPYYYCYREFFSHLECRWVLADIPNFPFHYAKYLYRNDPEVEFVTIESNDFLNPLGEAGDFDVILLTTVLEHLDNPLFVADYLLKRLKPGGLFVFDYIKSEGTGLDHPKALELRRDCLERILAQTDLIQGTIRDLDKSVGLCIARKKAG